MSSKVISVVRNYVKRELLSLDNTYKTPKNSNMRYILNCIENDTSLTSDDVKKMFNLWFKMSCMLASKKKSNLQYLQAYKENYMQQLFVYFTTFKTVYNVTDSYKSMLNYIISKWTDDSYDDSSIFDFFKNDEVVLMEVKDKIYVMYKQSNGVVISVLATESNILDFNYTVIYSEGVRDCSYTCCNTDCPHYKQSKGAFVGKIAKSVFCDDSDVEKCGILEKTNTLPSGDIFALFEAISYIMSERTNKGKVSEKRNDYEHLPVPEREDDVVVYFGNKVKRELPFIKVEEIKEQRGNIPSSHASPREHIRRNKSRKSTMRFNPKTGKKDIKVRGCEKVKDCIVNKGHTKTSYKFVSSKDM